MLFSQIFYALDDIKRSKVRFSLILLQILIAFLLLNSTLSDLIRVVNGLSRIENLKTQKAYVNADQTSNAKINALLADEKNTVSKSKQLFDIMMHFPTEKYTKWQYATSEFVDGHQVMQVAATRSFIDIFSLGVSSGRFFTSEETETSSAAIPVVAGYALKSRYPLGKSFTMTSESGTPTQFLVIGILKPESSYPSLTDFSRNIDLSYTLLQPINPAQLSTFSSLDMAINSTVFFTDDPDRLVSIEQTAKDLGLFTMHYQVIHDRISDFMTLFEKKILYQFFIVAIILLFAVTSMALNLSTLVKKQMNEFAIHLMCGGTRQSLLLRLLLQLMILMLLSVLPAAFLTQSLLSLLYTVSVAVLIAILVMILPLLRINSQSLIQLNRRSE